ncbi:SusC/RagA family TonB-linked outer membrane protein [Niastella populi]|uniref:SusC/RagA family TonB-linked outer membrane protein n=1 Tax=Niastella populi TaxID=550983 RepID=A0A1V9FEE6_9BACT|nr:SusC/RagA family TonB-linked outer membrane protein [Niastella populi]OQP56661.1 SusC/RagA family TonB-linked outer membrane protein [Niastella populi]
MKLTIIFLALSILGAQAETFSQTITFTGKNVSIVQVFNAVEKQTGYTIFANKELLKGAKPVTASAVEMPLVQFLDLIFNKQPLGYEISSKTIFIKDKTPLPAKQSVVETVVEEIPPITITGIVRSANGTPLEGASVSVKGSGSSSITDASGRYSIRAEGTETLLFSFVGFVSQEVAIKNRTNIDVSLVEADTQMNEVVVTALGITRKSKSLTYNVQEVKGDEVNRVKDANFVNSLAGKVAGATINGSSAGAGSSSRVVLRGTKSIYNNNNALYVIDGVPMQNNIRGQAEDIFSGAGQTGDFVSNINPEDIESISVLSGPSAAALYGSTAANGVIIINTKKGSKNKAEITASNSTMFNNPLLMPEFQNRYGQSEPGSYYSWGEKLQTPSSYKPKDFFQTGTNVTNAVTFSTGSERSQTYVSLGHVDARGIIPNNKFSRYNFTGRNTSTFLDGKMTLDLSFMGGLVNEQNMISQGQYFNPLVAVYLFPPGEDFNKVKAFERYNPSRNLMTQFWPFGDNGLMMQNPYWVTQRDLFPNRKDRYLTNASLKYQIKDWVNIAGRVKLDRNNEKAERKYSASTNQLFASEKGYYSLNTLDNQQIYADVLVNVNKQLNADYTLTGVAGASIEDIRQNQYLFGGRLQGVANLYTYTNINPIGADIQQTGIRRQKQAVFASAQLAYRNGVFFDITARNDWASSLALTKSQSFFYYSAGLSGVLTDLLPIKSDILSYLKLRGSYSEVGNEPAPFLSIPTYPLANGLPVTLTSMPNYDLQPELTKSAELGVNASFLKGALSIDATIYHSRTYNQPFKPTLSPASGFLSIYINGGRVDNKGVEATARYTRKFGELSVSSFATYALNRNKIVEMLPAMEDPGTKEIITLDELNMAGTGSYRITLKKGGTMGDIYVNTLRVDEHGAIYVDPASQTVAADPNRFIYAGSSMPKYNLSWGNNLNWKGIGLSFLFTARVGGIVVSNTQAMLDAFGVSEASAKARDNGGAIVNGRPIPAKEYYQVVGAGASGGIASMYTYSATNVRLAEATLGYDLPVKKWNKVVKKMNVSLIGRNLFLLYSRAPFDPELTANTGTYFQGIDYFMAPSQRSFGFSVKLNF